MFLPKELNDLIKLGRIIGDNKHLMKFAIYNGFDVNWLFNTEILENIEQIHKYIKT